MPCSIADCVEGGWLASVERTWQMRQLRFGPCLTLQDLTDLLLSTPPGPKRVASNRVVIVATQALGLTIHQRRSASLSLSLVVIETQISTYLLAHALVDRLASSGVISPCQLDIQHLGNRHG